MKKQRKLILTLALALMMVLIPCSPVLALTTQDVEITATPSYITISNAPTSWAAGLITAGVDKDTGNAYFTITNGSSVNIDISFYVTDNWSGTSSWTYGAPAADTAQLKVSSANGGTGGSTGQGNYDKTLVYGVGSAVLVCDNVTTATSPTWEMQLDSPSSFTHGFAQSCNLTMTAVAE